MFSKVTYCSRGKTTNMSKLLSRRTYRSSRAHLLNLCKRYELQEGNLFIANCMGLSTSTILALQIVNGDVLSPTPFFLANDFVLLFSFYGVYSSIQKISLLEEEIISKCEEKHFKSIHLAKYPNSKLYDLINCETFGGIIEELRK